MQLTRRESLVGASALMVAASSRTAALPAFRSLSAVAQRSSRRFGTAVMWTPPEIDAGSITNPRYAGLVERECSLLVPENQLKWQWVRRSPDSFDFRAFDAIANYASGHGFMLRGHTLFWTPTKWYPKWLADMQFHSASEAERLLTEHVRTVCRRYGTLIYSYDVVNEAVQPETGEIRDTNVTLAIGKEHFLDLMYHTARAEAAHAQLVYNDYMSWERNSVDESHMRGVLKLLEGFRKRGTPVDALGVQSHIRLMRNAPVAELVREAEGPWRRFIDEVVAMGYKLLITEFDVNDHAAPTDIAVRDQMVADYGRAYLDLMLNYSQLSDILAWGLTDRYSWLETFDPRADKARKRGTPYDLDFRPKLLRASIADAFRLASSSRAS